MGKQTKISGSKKQSPKFNRENSQSIFSDIIQLRDFGDHIRISFGLKDVDDENNAQINRITHEVNLSAEHFLRFVEIANGLKGKIIQQFAEAQEKFEKELEKKKE